MRTFPKLTIDPAGPLPPSEQIVRDVKSQVAKGTLRRGDRLPAIRELATELKINPNTVQKAYRELTRAGVIYSRMGIGMLVAPISTELPFDEREDRAAVFADRFIVEAIHLGLGGQAIRRLLIRRLALFAPDRA